MALSVKLFVICFSLFSIVSGVVNADGKVCAIESDENLRSFDDEKANEVQLYFSNEGPAVLEIFWVDGLSREFPFGSIPPKRRTGLKSYSVTQFPTLIPYPI